MSENEYKKLRLHLRILTILVVALIVLLTASLTHRVISPQSTSFPKIQVVNGKNGKDAQIDYSLIEQYIQQQIASIPIPQNGHNGADGQSIQGPPGIPGVGTRGPTGAQGPQGEPGSPGKEIELRYNPNKHETEWRYIGDFTWNVLEQDCQIINTCEAQ